MQLHALMVKILKFDEADLNREIRNKGIHRR